MDYTQKLKHHFKPHHGFINDPNGLVYFNGYYHLFYQYWPKHEEPWKEPAHWGHARTKDFITYEELPIAIAPDMPYDGHGCWSGTATVKDGVLYLIYTSMLTDPDQNGNRQTVSIVTSRDGEHFDKYAGNPVISDVPADGGPDFRDPAVACIDGKYYLVMASGNPEADEARLLLYTSEDLFHWEYLGVAASWENARYNECPSLVPMADGVLLAASVVTHDGNYFSAMFGDFCNGKFTSRVSGRVDRGPDQYAGQSFLSPDGRVLLIGWMPGWDYVGYREKDVGCLTVPREIYAKDGALRIRPAREVLPLAKGSDPAVVRTDTGFTVLREGREPLVYTGEVRDLQIFRDGYVLEVFLNDGEDVFTVLL